MGNFHVTTAISRGKSVTYLCLNSGLSVAWNRNFHAFVGIDLFYKATSQSHCLLRSVWLCNFWTWLYPPNNSLLGTVKYLNKKNERVLILVKIKNCTFKYLMLDNFFQRSANHKQFVNKKQVIERDSPVSSGGQGKYMFASTGLCWRQHCQLFTLAFLLNPFSRRN